MPQIADWLEKLGMAKYAERFAENDIDMAVLLDLTDQHLEDLGVSLGHRLKMRRAIRDLSNVSAAVTAPSALLDIGPTRRDDAERRQLTVMFTDLVGSTALSTKLDPEDLRSVIGAYHKCVAETVARFDGFVARYMGDGVLIYFGYPHAHEDDAERAVRAGLAIIEAIGKLGIREPLRVRIGVATGLVVVGDLVGTGEAQERGVVGETPNLAARLQGIAEPNTVVIAEGTRRLLGNLFELRDLGPRELKGFTGPVRAFGVLQASSIESRFEAMHPGGLTTLVGREEELGLLLRRWSQAKRGKGQVVLLSGEAGIGKSRLSTALMEGIAAEPHTRLSYFCSPQHTDSAFYPIIGQFERAAGFAVGDTPQTKLEKLGALLAQTRTSPQDAALLAEMLSLPNDGRYPALELAPGQRRQKMLEALGIQLETLARSSPVLLIVEDGHWGDPTSLEAFGRALDLIATVSVLMIVTFRLEFEAPWIGRPHVTAMTISRLTKRQVGAMIDGVVGSNLLPAGIRQDIIERTDGIPLFVEEMTKAVLEAEGQGAVERTIAVVPSPALAVPASLHASLMARLDRLGPAKEVAQIGAAIGREFSHALLAAVVRMPEAELRSALDRLIQTGLLFRLGLPPNATYLFKHALVRDASYGTLLREPRRALHARIAEAVESQFAETAESQPELLAHHCTEAGLIAKAAALWGKAGQRSLARSALVEATVQLIRALSQIATLPGTPALRGDQIKLQVALVNALMHTKGHAAPETIASLDRARTFIEQAESLGESPEDPLLLFSVLYGFWVANYIGFNSDALLDLATECLALAEKRGTMVPLMLGHRLMATSLMCTGALAESRAHYDQAIAIYEPAEHRALATRFGQDMRVAALSYRSWALWLLGFPEAAGRDAEQALKEAREISQAATLMYALFHTSFTHICCGNYAAASAEANELVPLADERGSLFWGSLGMLAQGYVLALTGKVSDAVPVITSGIIARRSTAATALEPFCLSYLAGAHAELGNFDDALSCIREAMSKVETTKESWFEAEIKRTAGEIALSLPDPDATKAEEYFEHALAVARQQQAKSWELRAAVSMARLWYEQGKRQQAHDLLAPVYGWFTEGFDTRDLKEAKALLGELGQRKYL
ncbi:adenylate/guanylate cyclase domain-containing protein [Bradyrhizobium sp. Tv2a-2]|uniref:adenylate/guanylate cyclase domain-containing protein n=1 Tax=Bradyrhizobium sp. Tv2a-2 TaxID=113395 RepID=UPI00042294B6|nr:adenylate/guanylate cyclase domain-containing protein [Bradyrhizobium sp. Tv2a-2]